MALHGLIQVNGHEIGRWVAQRTVTAPDGINTYECGLAWTPEDQQLPQRRQPERVEFTLTTTTAMALSYSQPRCSHARPNCWLAATMAEPKRLNDDQRRAHRIRDDQCDVLLTCRTPGDALCLLQVPCRDHGARPDLQSEAERSALAAAWFAGYDKGKVDGYFGTHDERDQSPYADLDPYREEVADA